MIDTRKLMILLSCAYISLVSEHAHDIPVEGYETKLEDLGQHVEVPETPVRVIRIIKTIGIKVPVPYPVKVVEKVPYPVHVPKPYPVTKVIKVPYQLPQPNKEQPANFGHGAVPHAGLYGDYQAQEAPQENYGGFPSSQDANSYGDTIGSSYFPAAPAPVDTQEDHGEDDETSEQYGHNDGKETFQTKTFDQGIKGFLTAHSLSGSNGDVNGFHYR